MLSPKLAGMVFIVAFILSAGCAASSRTQPIPTISTVPTIEIIGAPVAEVEDNPLYDMWDYKVRNNGNAVRSGHIICKITIGDDPTTHDTVYAYFSHLGPGETAIARAMVDTDNMPRNTVYHISAVDVSWF
jgi:hypothetical protein